MTKRSSSIVMSESSIASNLRNRQVRDYIEQYFSEEPRDVSFARQYSAAEGLKPIHVPALVGKMISLLANLLKPKRILEIGTLGGYSSLWLAGALEEDGKLITLEQESQHLKVAQKTIAHAGLSDIIEIRHGNALDLLQQMIRNNEQPFDLIFLDADKNQYPDYLEPCIALSRKGTLILCDNLIPKRREIASPDPRDNEASAIYEFNQLLANHPLLESILVPTLAGEDAHFDAIGAAIVR